MLRDHPWLIAIGITGVIGSTIAFVTWMRETRRKKEERHIDWWHSQQ